MGKEEARSIRGRSIDASSERFEMSRQNDCSAISELTWDSDYFGIRCGRAVLSADTTDDEVRNLAHELNDYDFVSIQNVENSTRINELLATYSGAYLVDINVQLEKALRKTAGAQNILIVSSSDIDQQIADQITVEEDDYKFSKFVCDSKMRARSGYKVYSEWLKNARNQEGRYFALKMDGDRLAGFILFNIANDVVTMELVKVCKEYQGRHFASDLMEAIEQFGFDRGCTFSRVGTQINNIPAVNLYHRQGYRGVRLTSVYHYWR